MRALIVAVLITTFSGVAYATNDDAALYVHIGSKHMNAGEYNEINLGLGVEFPVVSGWVYAEVGAYKNSFYERTDYVMVTSPLFGSRRGTWEAGVGLINVHGYDNIEDDKAHGPVPYFRYRAVRVMVLGPVLGVSARVLTW